MLLHQLSTAQIAEFRAMFDQIDTNGDATITSLELYNALFSSRPVEEFYPILNELDPKGCGCFDFPEFLHIMIRDMPDPDAEAAVPSRDVRLDDSCDIAASEEMTDEHEKVPA